MYYESNKPPSVSDIIIAMLSSGRSSRRFKAILSERKLKRYKKESVSIALSRLRSKGYIEKSSSGWLLTEKGKKYKGSIRKENFMDYIESPFEKSAQINTIVAFDIPENDRRVRNWLRNQIKIFGYKMLQQSLWIGPGPLPTYFIKRLEDLKIKKYVKTFKILKRN